MARKQSPNQLANLRVPTSKQARENGSKGGKASVEAKRQRKTQKQQLELLLSLPLKNSKAKQQILELGLEENEINNQMAMNVALFNMIMKGGKGAVMAYNSIVDIVGDKDSEKKDLEIQRLREEVNKLKLEQKKIEKDIGGGNDSFEDLTPLAEKLGLKKDN